VRKYRQTRILGNLRLRARVLQLVRRFFTREGFLEVDTPIRMQAAIPERYIDPVPSGSGCLQASPELFMKRLLGAGYPRIFQICKCFRGNERGSRHLEEFTLLEWYDTGIDYDGFMTQCERLIRSVAVGLERGNTLHYQGNSIDLLSPWERIPVAEAFARWTDTTAEAALAEERFDERMVTDIEPRLGFQRPVFLYDYPAERGSLARLDPLNDAVAQRFELYIHGLELCNAFMELTDPKAQLARFQDELQAMAAMEKRCYPLPEAFLHALEDMPDAAGCALGLDRLVMLFADTGRIDEVVAFTPDEL
jgi:lysyl-tRNA synthetase class 2